MLFFTTLFSSDYFSIDEFVHLHPEEKQKMSSFEKIVQNEPLKLSIEQKKELKIVILYPSGEVSDYWRRSQLSFKKRLDLLGIKYTLKEHFIDATNVQAQKQIIVQTIQEESDYLIFTLNIDAHKKIINQILSQNRVKLILQNITTPLAQWEGNQPFLYVGFDHLEGTKLLANYFKEKFPNGANYAMLYFKKGYVSTMRDDGFISLVDKNFILKNSFYTEGNIQNAFFATNSILRENENLDFIYSCATDVSLGALEAIKDIKNPPLINGWGGGAKELALIKEKKLALAVMRINDDNGIAMAEAIKLALENKQKQIPQIYSGRFVVIDQKTDEKTLQEYKNRAFIYSGVE